MENKKTLVIGASDNPARYSNMAVQKLQKYNHEVLAIGQKETTINDIKVGTVKEKFTDVDTVTLYLNPQRQQEYYDYIISLNPKRVVFNPGTENPAFAAMLQQHQIQTEEACTLVLLSINQY